MSTIITRIVLSLGLSCALASTPALAFDEPDGQSVTVRTADLNLATPMGEQALRNRIAHAVKSVCGDVDHRNLRMIALVEKCRKVAQANAIPKMQLAVAAARRGSAYAANDTMPGRAGS